MKTDIYSAPSEIVSNGKKIQFKMAASPKAFSILADGIYSDKITAIIRELSTNASDSHIQAGHTKPFDVHLPTAFNQSFYIRDYGVGLTEEEIETIYSTFFESNKTDSNDCTGGFGLGSKTPLCYNTKSFTITSFKNGVKLIYSAYIDELGYPSLVKLHEEESDEPTGFKVGLTVKDSDKYDFEQKAAKVYRWFTIKPNFVGKKIDLVNPISKPFICIKHQYIDSIDYGTESGVVMGNIFYPVTWFNKSKFIVKCEVGSLDIETSREGLAFTEKTNRRIAYIKDYIKTNFANIISNELNSCKSMWDARLEGFRLKTENSDLLAGVNLKWNGKDIITEFATPNFSKCLIVNYGYKTRQLDSIRMHNYNTGLPYSTNIGFDGGIYINDSTYSEKRVKDHSNNHGRCLIIPDQATADELCDLLDFPKASICKTSDLPLNIKRGVRTKTVNKKTTVCKVNPYSHRKTLCFTNLEIDYNTYNFTDRVYVLSDRYDLLKDNGSKIYPNELNFLSQIETLGIKIPTILAVTKNQKKDIESLCESFWEWLDKTVKNTLVQDAIENTLVHYDTFDYFHSNKAENLEQLLLKKGHIIQEFCEAYRKSKQRNNVNGLIQFLNIPSKPKYDAVAVYKMITNRYPYLASNEKVPTNHKQRYVELIDKGEF